MLNGYGHNANKMPWHLYDVNNCAKKKKKMQQRRVNVQISSNHHSNQSIPRQSVGVVDVTVIHGIAHNMLYNGNTKQVRVFVKPTYFLVALVSTVVHGDGRVDEGALARQVLAQETLHLVGPQTHRQVQQLHRPGAEGAGFTIL